MKIVYSENIKIGKHCKGAAVLSTIVREKSIEKVIPEVFIVETKDNYCDFGNNKNDSEVFIVILVYL